VLEKCSYLIYNDDTVREVILNNDEENENKNKKNVITEEDFLKGEDF
jgi:hypothetical protein